MSFLGQPEPKLRADQVVVTLRRYEDMALAEDFHEVRGSAGTGALCKTAVESEPRIKRFQACLA